MRKQTASKENLESIAQALLLASDPKTDHHVSEKLTLQAARCSANLVVDDGGYDGSHMYTHCSLPSNAPGMMHARQTKTGKSCTATPTSLLSVHSLNISWGELNPTLLWSCVQSLPV